MSRTQQAISRLFAMEEYGQVVRIHGNAELITPHLRLGDMVSVESAQQDSDEAKRKAIMEVFVIQPQQTGLQAQLEMTKAAIQNPESTTVVFVSTPEEQAALTPEQQNEEKVLREFVEDGGAAVFDDPEKAAEHVTQVVSDRIN